MSNIAASKLLVGGYSEGALGEVARAARAEIGGRCSAIFCFVSSSWRPHLADLCEVLQIHGHCAKIFGCSADGLVAGGEELEDEEGCSLLFLHLEETEVSLAEGPAAAGDSHLFFGSPFGEPAEVIDAWQSENPGFPIYGGLAGGGRSEGSIFLFTEAGEHEGPGVVVRLSGRYGIVGGVSHGCRPIGEPLIITGAEGNVIETVANQKVCDVLEDTYARLSEEERDSAGGNILVGIAMSEYQEEHRRGDFLVSSILGGDPQTGSIAIAAEPGVGQTLQFQLRDKASAEADMALACQELAEELGGREVSGGLLFTCTGRGARLFGQPGYDTGMIAQHLGEVPLAGFFCNGEVAPAGERCFLHAFTASMAFFVDRGGVGG